MVESWSYNPINYYLLIFRKDNIINHITHLGVYSAVSHLLNYDDSIPGIDELNKELEFVLSRDYSSGIGYKDKTFGVVFTSKWLDRYENTRSIRDKTILDDIYQLIKSLERDKKLNKLLG